MSMMPAQRTQFADSKVFTAGATVRAGVPIVLQAADTTYGSQDRPKAIEASGNTVLPIAIPKGEPGKSYAAGEEFSAWLLNSGSAIFHVRVGTGAATRGSVAVQSGSGDGVTDAPAFGTGSRIYTMGVLLNDGVAGDFVALLVMPGITSKA